MSSTQVRSMLMRNDIEPSSCLPFEAERASSLHWLPWAVRFKLDGEGLRLSLQQWQALPLAVRAELVRLLPSQGFAVYARQAGASTDNGPRTVRDPIRARHLAGLFGCSLQEATNWLAIATPFARFAVAKLLATRRRE